MFPRELQVQIDDVYACSGSCAGCVLSDLERRATSPDMTPAVMDLAVARVVAHAASLAPLDRVNVAFGIADHLQMPVDYVVSLHANGARIVEAGRPGDRAHSGVFFTTSLIGKEARVISAMEEIAARTAGPVPMMPLVVLDPKQIKAVKFGPHWRRMVLAAKSLFGVVDLSINLSTEAVGVMSPAELLWFAGDNGFDEVTVNWTPTLSNAPQTLGSVADVRAWLSEFDAMLRQTPGIGTSYRPVIERTIQSVMCRGEDEAPTLFQVVTGIVPTTIARSIEIDHLGNLMPKFEAVGDVVHAERFGFPTFGNLADGTVAELLEKGVPRALRKIMALHATGACASCPVSSICAGTGFHVATEVARRTGVAGEGCPHVARGLIEGMLAEARARDFERAVA